MKANMSEIYMVAPAYKCEINQATRFLESKKPWILKALQFYEKVQADCGIEKLRSSTILFLGKIYNLQTVRDTGFSVTINNPAQNNSSFN